MGSLLKEILLRHQQWEADEKGQENAHAPAAAATVSAAAPSSKFDSTPQSSAEATKEEEGAQQKHCVGVQKARYRTRPPGLRSAACVNETSTSTPTLSSAATRTAGAAASHSGSAEAHTSLPATALSSELSAVLSSSSIASPVHQPSTPSLTASLAMPFTPYPVQQEMGSAIASVLTSSKPHVVPIAVAEVPTGCGKTMALLSEVLRYQQQLKRMTPKEAEVYLRARQPPWQQRPATPADKKKSKAARRVPTRGAENQAVSSSAETDAAAESDENDAEDGTEAAWTVPRTFFKHFRVDSQRRIRAELDVTGSQELRRRFLSPPCTIYYVTRTHAQLRQAVRELRRLEGASTAIRMNILGSRSHYCIHPKVVQAKGNHTLPVEGNNLGEVCDKLVSVGLCEMVDKYDELSCSAIGGPIGHQRGMIWDMEDLVLEGSSHSMCPYYAARDLVFFADINFCTYPYLLDPLIRHETKMEAALKNNAVVVFDEAHNIAAVCQDALSLECPQGVIAVILSELAPLVANHHTLARQPTAVGTKGNLGDGFATLQYPRELYLGSYTLVEIFSFLNAVFHSLDAFIEQSLSSAAGANSATASHPRGDKRSREGDEGEDGCISGAALEDHLRRDMESFVRSTTARCMSAGQRLRPGARAAPALASLDLFQRAYSVIMSLGVTFNPFLFSVFGLSMLKRWLLLLRFLFQRSKSFVLSVRLVTTAVGEDAGVSAGPPPLMPSSATATRDGQRAGAAAAAATSFPQRGHTTASSFGGNGSGTATSASRAVVEVRCLDGSLAFNHLLHSVHRVVLASGTLAPFTQLARDLGVTAALWRTVEGLHVVPTSHYRLAALTALPASTSTASPSAATPLRCTYASLSNPAFLKAVARCVVQLARTVQHGSGGGVLFFVPNYAALHSLAKMAREVLLAQAQNNAGNTTASPIQLFLEPRKAEALTQVLHEFQCCTQGSRGGTALFFCVYRGKVSEGIDFTDDMARLVICLGVPLQPLKSWKVVAQRSYSGPDWYTTDAVRAVNQALGRCLRHARDYGAVVLLDERYAQAEYQQRLSRWCRTSLQVETSLPSLCDDLQSAFARWRRELGGGSPALTSSTSGSAPHATLPAPPHSSSLPAPAGDAVRDRLGTDQLPFQRVRRTAHTTATLLKAERVSGVAPPSNEAASLLQSPFACTAVKLLYETCRSTGDVLRQDLHAAVALLAETFGEDEMASSQE